MKLFRKNRPEINASSMADIAFLLLVFFLVVTTIPDNRGLMAKLPPHTDYVPPQDVHPRNVLEVNINAADQLLVENEWLELSELKDLSKRFLDNWDKDPRYSVRPELAIISLKTHAGASYEMYMQVQGELKAAYRELRDAKSIELFHVAYDDASKAQQKTVADIYPMFLSEAEPD